MIEWEVLEWMTKRMTEEKTRLDATASDEKTHDPVKKTLQSMVLRQQTFLDLDVDGKIEYLERKITHRQCVADTVGATSNAAWKKLVQQNTKESCEAVRDVINYTKRLVSSVKQNMRVLWLEAKKHFPKTPGAYFDIIPYPSDAKYDPTARPFEVDDDLFTEDESGNSGAVWGYLDKARDGFYDAKLIACYGHAGVGWPVLKCDGTDSRDSYPMTLRARLITITTQLDAKKAKKKAEEEAEKVRAEQERLDALRVKVTFTAAVSDRDYKTMPIHISPS